MGSDVLISFHIFYFSSSGDDNGLHKTSLPTRFKMRITTNPQLIKTPFLDATRQLPPT